MSAADLEKLWDRFVPRLKGQRVSEIVGPSVTLPNADYVFRDDNIIAELKVLETDLFMTNAGQDALNEMMDRWRRDGLVNFRGYGTVKLQSENLPEPCQLELARYAGRRLSKVVHEANKQIKSTKAQLGMHDAFGMLILINDGSYHLTVDTIGFTMANELRHRWADDGQPTGAKNECIDHVLALSVSMPARTLHIPEPTEFWFSMPRDSHQLSKGFRNRLDDAWFNYLADITGKRVPVYTTDQVDVMRTLKFTEDKRGAPEWTKKKRKPRR